MLSRALHTAGRSRLSTSNFRSFSSTVAAKSGDYDVVVVGKIKLVFSLIDAKQRVH